VPLVTAGHDPGAEPPARPAGRVLSGTAGPRGRNRNDRLRLIHGGQAPGRPRESEPEERDQARARLPLPGPRRIVVLGCTSGAGQTVTALMLARLLASLRGEPVAALDLNPGSGSLTERARSAPAGHGTHDIEVIGADAVPASVSALGQRQFSIIGRYLSARYRLSLIDPGASAVAGVLAIADQLVLVAPAGGDAPRAVSMTQKWLASHDHRGLAASAIMVLNGVSGRTIADVERAEAMAAGRCRAIIRVPWEDQLDADGGPGAGAVLLRPPARRALTTLAGALVAGLAAGSGEPR
jgi:MinD-like ATPase involved in chromosome partitioning or flagellar assembly